MTEKTMIIGVAYSDHTWSSLERTHDKFGEWYIDSIFGTLKNEEMKKPYVVHVWFISHNFKEEI